MTHFHRSLRRAAAALIGSVALASSAQPSEAEQSSRRRDMVAEIRHMGSERPVRAFGTRVLEAMERVPRHRFVPDSQVRNAYENRPLPIGHGQTISQPYIVALMTDLLGLRKEDRVLEVGTGSGYQAAVLAELVRSVYTIEIVEPLGLEAKERLARLGYKNVAVRIGDGYHGWEEHAPFDAIMVTAGAEHVPPRLVQQLKTGGRMVIPVGPVNAIQQLMLLTKRADGTVESKTVIPVRFVPLTGKR